jgi:hypothetical protein
MIVKKTIHQQETKIRLIRQAELTSGSRFQSIQRYFLLDPPPTPSMTCTHKLVNWRKKTLKTEEELSDAPKQRHVLYGIGEAQANPISYQRVPVLVVGLELIFRPTHNLGPSEGPDTGLFTGIYWRFLQVFIQPNSS